MGAERWVRFKDRGTYKRAKAFSEHLTPDGNIVVGSCDVWLDWKRAPKLEIGHTMGHGNSTLAALVSREFARRFEVVRIGADSVGWYPDSDWLSDHPRGAKVRYGPYSSWAEWVKDYKVAWDITVTAFEDEEAFQAVDDEVTALFRGADERFKQTGVPVAEGLDPR